MQFKTYSKSRLDDHINLVQDVIKDWDWKLWYPEKEELAKTYSQEGFTPETRHYVYENELLVGFLSSAVEEKVDGIQYGSIHILFIRQGYEHIEEELMTKTIEVLKSKGVEVIRTASMPGWGNYSQTLEQWGFKKEALLAQRTIFEPSDLLDPHYTVPDSIVEIALPQDKEKLVEAMQLYDKRSKEEINQLLDELVSSGEYFAGAIVMKDNKPLSAGLLTEGYSSTTAFLSRLPIPEESFEWVLQDLFLFLVHKAHKLGITLLWHQMFDVSYAPYYAGLNLKFEPFHRYLLPLSREKE
ncbi:MAG: hypothetical protein HZR80_01175 [Candidatus Heimdallarchaeota archaeon]